MNKQNLDARRPLKVRQAGFAQSVARWLSNKNITPNQISIMSVVFAFLSAVSLYLIFNTIENANSLGKLTGQSISLYAFLAAIFIQCRLLCNLFDGMVAIEGQKSTPAGELFNDIPDRIADPLILIALGFAASQWPFAMELGFIAGLLSVMTAYVRTLAKSIGAPTDFCGPMAKQHRMALVTISCLVAVLLDFIQFESSLPLYIALLLIVAGCLVTLVRRIKRAYTFLENKNNTSDKQGA